METIKHPAKYTDTFLPIFAELLQGYVNVLDPFAGVGKLAKIKDFGFAGRIICNEIEPDWAASKEYDVDEWHVGDAEYMSWCDSESVQAVCTSPTYGNRMADTYVDSSKRITYTAVLGKKLATENTGAMQWGERYRRKHRGIYQELHRVMSPGGRLIVNLSNHIRGGKVVDVVGWTAETLSETGFIQEEIREVATPRMGFGQNAKLRVPTEHILIYSKPSLPIYPELE